MKTASLALVIGLGVVTSQAACSNGTEPTAPRATEAVPVTVNSRAAASNENVPAIHTIPAVGSLAIAVTESSSCATVATAAIDRAAGTISLVLHVSGDPRALCGPIPNFVIDYGVTIGGLSPGAYRINVFQGLGDGTPKFFGSASATVLGGIL